MFIVSIVFEGVVHTGVIRSLQSTTRGVKISLLSLLLVFPSILLQVFSSGKIFYAMKLGNQRAPPLADGSHNRSLGNFLYITTFQIVAFIVCNSPVAISQLMILADFVDVKKILIEVFGALTRLNALIDPIVFLVVYRRKLRRRHT